MPVSWAIADNWAVLSLELESKGKTRPVFDGLMAVTALEYDLAVVTRNETNFAGFDVQVFNPWDDFASQPLINPPGA